MLVRKCDRCGKHYEENHNILGKDNEAGHEINGIITYRRSVSMRLPDEVFDLCDDCLAELYEFMKVAKLCI